jgi:Hypoxia induced protein conserved region
MAQKQDDTPVMISEDDARGGVTGHHVRYVLAFGLAGIIVALSIIGAYFGFGALTQAISKAEGLSWRQFVFYSAFLAVGVLAAGLLFGLWSMVGGRSENASQTFMRWRVVLQFIAICLAMAALYISAR